MTLRPQEPHSRWRLRKTLDGLASSYDAAADAIDTFARAAQGYDPRSARPGAAAILRGAVHRIARSRGWVRTIWFAATLLLAGSFLAWISREIIRRFIPGPVPAVLAVTPGVLVALTMGGTAAVMVRAPLGGKSRLWPFVITLAACAAWVAAWLIGVARLATWFAIATAVLAAAVAGVAFLAASQPATPPSPQILAQALLADPPRRLLGRQQAAQHRLRGHAERWSSAAHACGLLTGGSAPVEEALNRLLSTGTLGELPVRDVEAFHIQMLTALFRYQPEPLGTRLRAASARLLPYQAQSIAPPDRSIR